MSSNTPVLREQDPAVVEKAQQSQTMEEYARAALGEDSLESLTTGGRETVEVHGRQIEDGKGRKFPCNSCGADMVWNVEAQSLKCEYCGHARDLNLEHTKEIKERDLNEMLVELASKRADEAPEDLNVLKCDSCGGEVEFFGNLSSKNCCYCGSPIQQEMMHHAEGNRISIDAVIPFFINRDMAKNHINEWIKGRWFAPNSFLKLNVQERLTALYLPFWTFDTITFTVWSGRRGDNYTVTVGSGKNRRTETRTRWTSVSGSFQLFFDDVLVLAANDLPVKHVEKLEPWPLQKALPFNQQVLSGYMVRKYDVGLPDGYTRAKSKIEDSLRDNVKRRIGGDKQRISSMNVSYDACSFKHVLLPVYTLPLKYKGKVYRIVVNASTGEVNGERPYSIIKITLAVIAGLIVIGLIYLFFQNQ